MRVVLKILVVCLIWPSLFVQAQPVPPAPSNLPVQEKEHRWEQASDTGKKAFGENRYDEAEDQFKQALALATEMKSDWRLGYSHDCLAEFYRLRERPKDARPHFEKAYENFSEALNYDDAA